MSLALALDALVAAPVLLVVSDFDGVLSPIQDDPATSALLPGAAEALTSLSRTPGTVVGLLSGRTLADLQRLTGLGPPIRLVGSHGVQWADRPEHRLDPGETAALAALTAAYEQVAAPLDGVWVERKRFSAVLHTRLAPPQVGAAATAAAQAWLAGRVGLHTTLGKNVVDTSVIEVGKGFALQTLRTEADADAVVYLGDDVTDEHAFARLGPADVGVKVGAGETAARFRVDAPVDAVAFLVALAAARRQAEAPE